MFRMKLADFLKDRDLTVTAFAAQIERAPSTVSRIVKGQVHPDPQTMQAIITATDGSVTANDFFNLVSVSAA